jgi:hypothetical protein
MSYLLFGLCCFLALTAISIMVMGWSVSAKCAACVKSPSIYCYNDWVCAGGENVKNTQNDLLDKCSRTSSADCPCISNWNDTIPSTGPSGDVGATAGYDPSLSRAVTTNSLCSLWSA